MPDLENRFGSDLTLTASGDIATVDGNAWTTERVIRRLATAPGGYIWQLDYGAGLPGMVGSPASRQQIQGIVTEQMAMEAGVDQTQPIGVTVTGDNAGAVNVAITYTDAASGQEQTALVPAS